jgi:hypothetical protein
MSEQWTEVILSLDKNDKECVRFPLDGQDNDNILMTQTALLVRLASVVLDHLVDGDPEAQLGGEVWGRFIEMIISTSQAYCDQAFFASAEWLSGVSGLGMEDPGKTCAVILDVADPGDFPDPPSKVGSYLQEYNWPKC